MKYTAIYVEGWQSGSHWHSLTKMKRIETKPGQSVGELLEEHNIADSTQYLFHGWPKMQGEEE